MQIKLHIATKCHAIIMNGYKKTCGFCAHSIHCIRIAYNIILLKPTARVSYSRYFSETNWLIYRIAHNFR